MRRIGALAVVLVLALAGCAPSGDDVARAVASEVAERVVDQLTPPYPIPTDAQNLAANVASAAHGPARADADVRVDVLDWGGHSGSEEGAVIRIRVDVHVPEFQANQIGQRYREAGDATRCWDLTIWGSRNYDNSAMAEVECPEGAPALTPERLTPTSLPADAEQVLVSVLGPVTTAADAEAAVQAEYPEDYYSVEVADRREGIVVALGLPESRDCFLAIRADDGTVRVDGGWPPEWLMPGEAGCSPQLLDVR